MSFSRWSRVVGALLLGALAWTAQAAVDVTVANNSQVESRLLRPDSLHRYRVFLPAGANVSLSVKGKKNKQAGTAAPVMRLRLLDDLDDELIASGFLDKAKQKDKGTGSKAKATVEDSATYVIEVFSADGSVGDYTFAVKWSSPKAAKIKDELFGAGDETDVEVSVDEDAQLTMSVKASGGSARPFFARIEGDELDQDLEPSAKLKGVTVLEGGDLYVVIGNTSGEGKIAGSVKIKQPKTKKSKVTITPVKGGTEDKKIIGAVSVPSKGVLVEADDEDLVGEDILGASVFVPAGAVSQPTSIQIGTADPLLPPNPEAGAPAGPTVFFGPEGLQFEEEVTVTIPFDPDALGDGDTDDLQVFTEDAEGNVEEIEDFDVDVDGESVSFQTSHFSTFRVFVAGAKPGKLDLDADGVDDLVLPAPNAGQGAGRVYVFSGVPELDADTSEADVTIRGLGAIEAFGSAVAVGDVTGDGVADLVVLGDGVLDGTCYVFPGGPAFGPQDRDDAAVRLDGAAGFGGMTSVAVGDVNGDGVGDIAIGGEDGANGAGLVVVFFGGAELRTETTSGADLVFTGEATGDLFGASVAIGDLNTDGRPDLAVGADMIDNPGRPGAVYVQLGGSGIQGAAAASMDAKIAGSGPGAGLGIHLAIGDVTGDGNGDLVASEFDDDLGGPGTVYVFRGRGTFAATTSTSDAVFFVAGSQAEVVGSSLQLADVSRDGVLDLIIGARGASQGDGGIFIVYGDTEVNSGQGIGVFTPNVAGPGFLEGFPVLGSPVQIGRNVAIVAFAPGNEDADTDAGTAYLFLGDPRARQIEGPLSTGDADLTISGQAGDMLGGDIF